MKYTAHGLLIVIFVLALPFYVVGHVFGYAIDAFQCGRDDADDSASWLIRRASRN